MTNTKIAPEIANEELRQLVNDEWATVDDVLPYGVEYTMGLIGNPKNDMPKRI